MDHRTTTRDASPNGHPGSGIASPLASKRISHSYYVAMVDYGPNYIGKTGPSGFEAVVDPETTRRGMVELIRTGELKNIAFIHHVEGGHVFDCTEELMHDAGVQLEAAE